MALILLGIDVLADVLVPKENNAMPAQATLFSRLLQHLPWSVLKRAVVTHEMDKGHRVLDARSHLVALMAGQLIEAHGLRDIEAALAAHAPALKRRRIEPACRSTLADANKVRSPAAFEGLIPALLAELSPTKARRTKEDLRLVDSTLVHPGSGAEGWAHFQNGKVAAKVHVVYDPKAEVPTFYELTSGNTNDITVAKTKMLIEAGATYVFDLGYYDFGFWADLDAKGCRFVTRLKIPRSRSSRSGRSPLVPTSSARRSFVCPSAWPQAEKIPSPRTAGWLSSPSTPARSSNCSPTTSTARPRPSPISTRAAGKSSCSSAGSSKT
jgi:hypothetical protein